MIEIAIIIAFLYFFLIGSFIYGFKKTPIYNCKDLFPKTRFSIIIPFRNEAKNLSVLLNSIKELNYSESLFEIIFVNDHSSDDSVSIIEKTLKNKMSNWMIIENLENTKSPKKDAITTALLKSKFSWIVTTDADCKLPIYWLKTFDSFIQEHDCSMVAAPVKYDGISTFLDKFQNLDFISLIGTTIGSFGIKKPFLANGANLAYKKSFFKELHGFENNTKIASGDDVFLLQKAVKNRPGEVFYLKSKDAIVSTKPQPTWHSLVSQRIRWASKSSSYNNAFAVFTGFTVLLMNMLFVISFLASTIGITSFAFPICIIFLKLLIDFLLIYQSSAFLNHKLPIIYYLLSSFTYPFFIIYIVFLSTFKNYDWKGRRFYK